MTFNDFDISPPDSEYVNLETLVQFKIGAINFFTLKSEDNSEFPDDVYFDKNEILILSSWENKLVFFNLITRESSTVPQINNLINIYSKKLLE